MRMLSKNEGWTALVLIGAVTISGVSAVVGWMPEWVPLVVCAAYAFILIRSQLRRTDGQNLGDEDE